MDITVRILGVFNWLSGHLPAELQSIFTCCKRPLVSTQHGDVIQMF